LLSILSISFLILLFYLSSSLTWRLNSTLGAVEGGIGYIKFIITRRLNSTSSAIEGAIGYLSPLEKPW